MTTMTTKAEYIENPNGFINVYNADCMAVLNHFDDNSIDLILTDPPYGIANFAKKRGLGNQTLKNRSNFSKESWDKYNDDEFLQFMTSFFEIAATKLKTGGTLLMFTSFLRVPSIVQIAEMTSLYYKTTGVWHKTNPLPRNMKVSFVVSNEAWMYFVNSQRSGTFNNYGKLFTDFISTPTAANSERNHGRHPTQKPVSLMKFFVEILSNPGDVICDPFMGIGTTGVACNALQRNFIGIEQNSEYYQIALHRMYDL